MDFPTLSPPFLVWITDTWRTVATGQTSRQHTPLFPDICFIFKIWIFLPEYVHYIFKPLNKQHSTLLFTTVLWKSKKNKYNRHPFLHHLIVWLHRCVETEHPGPNKSSPVPLPLGPVIRGNDWQTHCTLCQFCMAAGIFRATVQELGRRWNGDLIIVDLKPQQGLETGFVGTTCFSSGLCHFSSGTLNYRNVLLKSCNCVHKSCSMCCLP